MAIERLFYVLTEEELHELLRKQVHICSNQILKDGEKVPQDYEDLSVTEIKKLISDAPEPNLPPLLNEWKVVRKITGNE